MPAGAPDGAQKRGGGQMGFHKVEADDRPVLDGDMTGADMCDALARLSFRRSGLQMVALDKAARDYLIAAVLARQCKA
jgi:hypothetical protein